MKLSKVSIQRPVTTVMVVYCYTAGDSIYWQITGGFITKL